MLLVWVWVFRLVHWQDLAREHGLTDTESVTGDDDAVRRNKVARFHRDEVAGDELLRLDDNRRVRMIMGGRLCGSASLANRLNLRQGVSSCSSGLVAVPTGDERQEASLEALTRDL